MSKKTKTVSVEVPARATLEQFADALWDGFKKLSWAEKKQWRKECAEQARKG